MMAHQNPPYLAFCTPGQNETKNKIQGYQRETNKNIYIFLNEHQGMKGMGNIQHEEIQRVKTFVKIIQATQSWQNS